MPFRDNTQHSSHLRVLTYDFLQLVRLPGNWPAGCQRWLRVVDRSRRFALIRHDDDDDALVSSLSRGQTERERVGARGGEGKRERESVKFDLTSSGTSVSWRLQQSNYRLQ